MLIAAESFQTYLRRRRRMLTRRLKRQQGWGLVLALLALYLLSWEGLLPRQWSGQPLWLVLIPLLGGGLYSLGTGVIWMLRQRWFAQGSGGSAQLLAQMVSLPHLALAALIWLGLAVWGEHLLPLLARQKPQLLAGLLISWLLAQGWSFLRPGWMVEAGQLWTDYLQELRGSVLQPCYQRLETCRHSLRFYHAIWQDLQLEEIEAQHLLQLFSESLPPPTWPLQVYAQQVRYCCQQLSDLLARMQERVERLEQVLLDVELELEAHQPLQTQPQPINLLAEDWAGWQELDLQELVWLNQELLGTDRSLQGLTQELKGWADQAIPVGVKSGRWLGSLG
ncbi:hypothetical protein L1047_01330 [Synechococcus sp. Nb3U1]|uniref:hypothetical protein n=1 Tax=Synechococcus sp. Nb3U1 TaxID=1914529 RepID=UPI001F2EC486|nr:hypothetical protein [Synechococcus sp. Nb3U1]MCF2969837.1 hypothetical protein [Synechococcus sp. Nb3U1]